MDGRFFMEKALSRDVGLLEKGNLPLGFSQLNDNRRDCGEFRREYISFRRENPFFVEKS